MSNICLILNEICGRLTLPIMRTEVVRSKASHRISGELRVAWRSRMSVPLYAASGILEVWLIDLNTDTIEVYSEPGPGAYEKSASDLLPKSTPGRSSLRCMT